MDIVSKQTSLWARKDEAQVYKCFQIHVQALGNGSYTTPWHCDPITPLYEWVDKLLCIFELNFQKVKKNSTFDNFYLKSELELSF
jgi:hypothetical protein